MNEHYLPPGDNRGLPTVTGGHQVAVYNPFLVSGREGRDLDLRQMWQIVKRYRWLVASVISVAILATLMLTLMMRPVYRASALVELKPNPAVLSFESVGRPSRNADAFRKTQMNIMLSEAVTGRVIQEKSLAENPEFTGELRQRGLSAAVRLIKHGVSGVLASISGSATLREIIGVAEPQPVAGASRSIATPEERSERAMLGRYMSRLSVEQVQQSDLVTVSFESFDPRVAAELANAHTREYIEFIDQRRFNSTSSAKEYLQQQIEDAEVNLGQSEKALTDFARHHNIVDVEDRGNVMQRRFEDLSRALTTKKQERIMAQIEYKQAQEGGLESLPAVLDNQLIKDLQQRYAEVRAEYGELSSVFRSNYPKMRQLQSRIDDYKAMLEEESVKLVMGLRRQYEQLAEQESELEQQMSIQRTELLDLKERAISYNILKREWEANRELYTGLLERQKDFSVASGMEFNDASIVDLAVAPTSKYRPDSVKNVTMAGLFGLVGGVGLAFLMAFLDNTFRSREELEQALGIPFMGIVPKLGSDKQRDMVPTALISAYQPANAIAEAIRSIRTGMLFSRPDHVPKKILVSSTTSGEGKSTLAMNLALILAQSGSSVLIIDADLRKPVIGSWLGIAQNPGLAEYLQGDDVDIIRGTNFENLFVVPAGEHCTRPTDLLASLRMRDYLEGVAERFDFVIIDGPPCLGVADSMLLSAKVDGTLLVVKAGSTEKHVVAETVNRLRMVNAPLIGSILNFVDLAQPEYGHYGTYYGYGNKGGTLVRQG